MTDKKLRKLAKEEYLDCRECGHYPEFITDCCELSDEEEEMYAAEYDMTVEEFRKYRTYLEELCN